MIMKALKCITLGGIIYVINFNMRMRKNQKHANNSYVQMYMYYTRTDTGKYTEVWHSSESSSSSLLPRLRGIAGSA